MDLRGGLFVKHVSMLSECKHGNYALFSFFQIAGSLIPSLNVYNNFLSEQKPILCSFSAELESV